MSPTERWGLHASALVTAVTGALDGGLRWFGQRMGEFGPEPSPWLGPAQHAHVLAAPLLVFTLGVLVRGHLVPRLRGGASGRATGLALAACLAPMVLSGYAIQVVVDPAWRTGWSWAHGVSASLFLLAYFGHLAAGLLGRAAGARQPLAESRSLVP